ncbi:hypothetical protein H072_9964, partial [Dactylellina haptotyla CBS 200.50]
ELEVGPGRVGARAGAGAGAGAGAAVAIRAGQDPGPGPGTGLHEDGDGATLGPTAVRGAAPDPTHGEGSIPLAHLSHIRRN